MTTVFMFPGQGSQSVGMGGDHFGRYPDLVAEADAILGYSIRELCMENPDGMLKRTDSTQPALYIVDVLSYLAKVQDEKIRPDFVIGHSLGEYPALYAAGAFDFATGLKLVQKRGALMNAATGGGMAAILGMTGDAVASALAELGAGSIDVDKFNSPGQTVISGPKADIEAFSASSLRACTSIFCSSCLRRAYSAFSSDASSSANAGPADNSMLPSRIPPRIRIASSTRGCFLRRERAVFGE